MSKFSLENIPPESEGVRRFFKVAFPNSVHTASINIDSPMIDFEYYVDILEGEYS